MSRAHRSRPRAHQAGSRSERGAVAVEYALAMALLMIPVAFLALSLPGWVDRQNLARTAAAEAARAAVQAPAGSDRQARAAAVVDEVARGNQLPTGHLRLTHYEGTGAPGTTVLVEVSATAVDLSIGGISAAGGTLTARHSAPVDVYRSR